tara:strand:- start:282 stop:395 length:114 start_codon:yes stop_codon:yes gene_type:complete
VLLVPKEQQALKVMLEHKVMLVLVAHLVVQVHQVFQV